MLLDGRFEPLDHASSFSSEQCPEGVIGISGNALRYASHIHASLGARVRTGAGTDTDTDTDTGTGADTDAAEAQALPRHPSCMYMCV
jgi:hypothetical protein